MGKESLLTGLSRLIYYNLLSTKFFFLFFFCFRLSLLFIRFDIKVMLEWDFFFFGMSNNRIVLFLDGYFILFFSAVRLIGRNVIFYRSYYMRNSVLSKRFILIVSLFIYSIFLFISRPNLLSMFLG